MRSRQFRRSLGLQFRGSFPNATVGPERERFRVRVHSRAGALAVVVVVAATTTSFRAFPRSLRMETRQCVVLSTARSRHRGSIRLIRLRKREKKKREEEENGEPRDREPSRLIPSRAAFPKRRTKEPNRTRPASRRRPPGNPPGEGSSEQDGGEMRREELSPATSVARLFPRNAGRPRKNQRITLSRGYDVRWFVFSRRRGEEKGGRNRRRDGEEVFSFGKTRRTEGTRREDWTTAAAE